MQAGRDALAAGSHLSITRGGGLFTRVDTSYEDMIRSLKQTLTNPECDIDAKEAASLRLIQLDPSRFEDLISFYYEQLDVKIKEFIDDYSVDNSNNLVDYINKYHIIFDNEQWQKLVTLIHQSGYPSAFYSIINLCPQQDFTHLLREYLRKSLHGLKSDDKKISHCIKGLDNLKELELNKLIELHQLAFSIINDNTVSIEIILMLLDLIPRGELSSFIGDLLSILNDMACLYTHNHLYSLSDLQDELKIVCHFQAYIDSAYFSDLYKGVLIWGLSYSGELFSLVCQYLCANYDKLSSSELSQIVFDLKQKIELGSDDIYLESLLFNLVSRDLLTKSEAKKILHNQHQAQDSDISPKPIPDWHRDSSSESTFFETIRSYDQTHFDEELAELKQVYASREDQWRQLTLGMITKGSDQHKLLNSLDLATLQRIKDDENSVEKLLNEFIKLNSNQYSEDFLHDLFVMFLQGVKLENRGITREKRSFYGIRNYLLLLNISNCLDHDILVLVLNKLLSVGGGEYCQPAISAVTSAINDNSERLSGEMIERCFSYLLESTDVESIGSKSAIDNCSTMISVMPLMPASCQERFIETIWDVFKSLIDMRYDCGDNFGFYIPSLDRLYQDFVKLLKSVISYFPEMVGRIEASVQQMFSRLRDVNDSIKSYLLLGQLLPLLSEIKREFYIEKMINGIQGDDLCRVIPLSYDQYQLSIADALRINISFLDNERIIKLILLCMFTEGHGQKDPGVSKLFHFAETALKTVELSDIEHIQIWTVSIDPSVQSEYKEKIFELSRDAWIRGRIAAAKDAAGSANYQSGDSECCRLFNLLIQKVILKLDSINDQLGLELVSLFCQYADFIPALLDELDQVKPALAQQAQCLKLILRAAKDVKPAREATAEDGAHSAQNDYTTLRI